MSRCLVVSLSRRLASRRRASTLAHWVVVATFFSFAACDNPQRVLAPTDGSARLARQTGATQDSQPRLLAMAHPRRIPGRYIVRFHVDTRDPESLARELVDRHGGEVLGTLRSLKGFWGELPTGAIDSILRDSRVRYVEADVEVELAGIGDTTQPSAPGPLDRMDQRTLPLDGMYKWSTDGTGVHIWIVDNGVDASDAELAGRVNTVSYFSYQGQNPHVSCTGNAHGTAMARAAAGRTIGIARNATVHSARVNSPGNCMSLSTGAASAAMEFIADWSERPAVINYSAASSCWGPFCGFTVDDAAGYAHDQGVTVVVAGGNANEDACGFTPAHVNRLITVGAVAVNDTRESYSNFGDCIDIWAPVNSGGGTSTATAYVSGAAALKLQLTPWLSPSWVWSQLLGNATTGALTGIGSGSPNKLLYTRQAPLTVAIGGPYDQMGPFSSCSWSAVESGGQPPYSYVWKRNGVTVGTTSSYYLSPVGPSDFSLSLDVVDGVGRTATIGQYIFVDPLYTDYWCGGF